MCMACDEQDRDIRWRREERVEDVGVSVIRNTQARADDGSVLWWGTDGWGPLTSATLVGSRHTISPEGRFIEDNSMLPEGGEWVDLSGTFATVNDAVPPPSDWWT